MQPFAASSAVLVSLPEGRGYPIYFAGLAEVPARLRQRGHLPGPCFVVTDAHVAEAHLPTLVAALEGDRWQPHVYTLPPGEDTKNVEEWGRVQTWALEHGIDRTRPLLALGGGVVGDLAGFAAATILRGVPLVQLPTSLIAQVDAAIGGKTGLNHPLGKNLLGAFYQPSLIVIDQSLLATLPDREYHSGLAEVVKYALIADAAFFDDLEVGWDALLARDPEVLAHAVQRSVELKAQIVSVDEREHGRRALLNFGHTFGHAIEKVSGYGTFTHGEAVALGMRAALHLSRALRLDLPFERADALVARLPVPEGLAYLSVETLMAAMGLDKKRVNGQLRFVVLDALGQARVVGPVDPALVASAWAYARVMGG